VTLGAALAEALAALSASRHGVVGEGGGGEAEECVRRVAGVK
jgi:hypothetical protein